MGYEVILDLFDILFQILTSGMQAVDRLATHMQSMPAHPADHKDSGGRQQSASSRDAIPPQMQPAPDAPARPATAAKSAAAAASASASRSSWAVIAPAASEDLSADDWLVVAGGTTAW